MASFINLAKVNWSMPEHTADLLRCWIERGGSKSRKSKDIVENSIYLHLVEHLEGKNERIFESKECTIQKIKGKVITSLCFWCKKQRIEEDVQLVDFIGLL